MKNYNVYAWLNDSDYDGGKLYDHSVQVRARSEGQAEEIGERQITKQIGKVDVIYASEA